MTAKSSTIRKYFPVLLTICCMHLSVTAQNMETVIKTQALDMAKAVLAKDVEKLVQYIPPKLVEAAGGKEKMLAARDTANKYMQQFGAEIKKVTIGNPGKIVSYKKQLQSLLPQTTELKFMAGLVIFESTLIAVSPDNGQHWYFVDTSVYHGDKFKNYLPELSPDLVIPPLKPPQIIADEHQQ